MVGNGKYRVAVKGHRSGSRLPRIKSWLCHFLAVSICQVNYFAPQFPCLLKCWYDNITCFIGQLEELYEITHVKYEYMNFNGEREEGREEKKERPSNTGLNFGKPQWSWADY